MPTDIDKALAGAKAALGSARSFTKSVGDSEPSKVSPKPAAAAPAPAAKPKSGITQEAGDAGSGIKARMENESAALGSMKKGGKIPKTGLYKMHEGEDVVKADKSNLDDVMKRATDGLGAAADRVRAAHGIRTTTIEHAGDGSHFVRHTPHDKPEYSYAAKDTKELGEKLSTELSGGKAAEPDGDEPKD